MTRPIAITLWVALLAAAVFAAPPTRPDVWDWCVAVMGGDFTGTDPTVVAHFQLMGVWPLATAVLLRQDLRARGLPAWPFVLGSMALGAFALLPWFALRPASREPRDGLPERLFGSLAMRALVTATAVGWVAWALATGDLGAWATARATDGFVWTMTLDFAALWLTSILVAREAGGPWAWALIPIAGAVWTDPPQD